MRRVNKILLCSILLSVVLSSCEDESEILRIQSESVTGLEVDDIGNAGNASDMQIIFNKVSDEEKVAEYRVIVVKIESGGILDVISASELIPVNYTVVNKTGNDIDITLPSDARDTDGEAIAEEIPYVVYVMSVADGVITNANRLSSVSRSITLSIRTEGVRSLNVADIGNTGNGLDFQVSFNRINNESKIEEYRVMVLKSGMASTFDLTLANTISEDRFTRVLKTGNNYQIELGENAIDIDGDLLTNGVPYIVYILSIADGIIALENALSPASREIILKHANVVSTFSEEFEGNGDLSIDNNGNIYSSSFSRDITADVGKEILKITPDGQITVFIEIPELLGAQGNTFSSGEIFQVSFNSAEVYRIGLDGTYNVIISPVFNSDFNSPSDVVISSFGKPFVASCRNNQIYRLDLGFFTIELNEIFPEDAETPLACPNQMIIDNNNGIYVANNNDWIIYKVFNADKEATIKEFARLLPGEFIGGMAFASEANDIFVTSEPTHKVYKINLATGNKNVIAGSGDIGKIDGDALTARFTNPKGIVVNPAGTLVYVTERVNTDSPNPVVLRKIELVE